MPANKTQYDTASIVHPNYLIFVLKMTIFRPEINMGPKSAMWLVAVFVCHILLTVFTDRVVSRRY